MFHKLSTVTVIAASVVALSGGMLTATSSSASAAVVDHNSAGIGQHRAHPVQSATVFPDYFNVVNSSNEKLLFQEVTGQMKTYGAPKSLERGQQQVVTLPETSAFGHGSGDIWFEVVSTDGVAVGELDVHIDDAHASKDRATILDAHGFAVTTLAVDIYDAPNQGQYLDTFEVVDSAATV